MKIIEFGNKNNKKIILIHGLSMPYQIFDRLIDNYVTEYHIIIPILSGHDISSDDTLLSVKNESLKIKEFILKQTNEIYMIIGVSLGAAVALSLLEDNVITTKYLILESGIYKRFSSILLAISRKIEVSTLNKIKKRDEKTINTFTKMFGDTFKYFFDLADNMNDNTIINAVSSFKNYKIASTLNLNNTNIIVFQGTSLDFSVRKSTKLLRKRFNNVYIKTFKKYHHCELSVNRPDEFIDEIELAIKNFNS